MSDVNKSAAANEESKLEMYEALRLDGITMLAMEPIGKGCFLTVCVAFSSRLKKNVAVKLINTSVKNEFIERFLPRELELVPLLSHSNIVRVHQILSTTSYTALIQEYAENGNLLATIIRRQRFDEAEGRFLFRQLIEAIKYLEHRSIIHRDIKCENIFLDCYSNVKLGDFGFARFLPPEQDTDTHCGSKAYIAPELLRGRRYTGNATDIWSAGVVLFIMLTGKMPFDDRKPIEMLQRQMEHSLIFPNGISSNAQQLIRQILHPRLELRATVREIVDSNWLKNCRYFMRGTVEGENTCSTASPSSPSGRNN